MKRSSTGESRLIIKARVAKNKEVIVIVVVVVVVVVKVVIVVLVVGVGEVVVRFFGNSSK